MPPYNYFKRSDKMEQWIMINKHIHPHIIENTYYISSFGRIKYNDIIYEPEYKSSNGYNYTLMKCIDNMCRLFPVDELVVRAFSLIPDSLKSSRIDIFHKNDDTMNDCVDNLFVDKFCRKWKEITYPGIISNAYEISNDGIVKSLFTRKCHKNIIDKRYGYIMTGLKHVNGAHKHVFLHRLVAWEYVKNRDYSKDVNHISGIKHMNIYKNLEWIDRKGNLAHAKITGLNNRDGSNSSLAKLDDAKVILICEKLIEYDGDIEKVLNFLNMNGDFSVSRWNIESIKYKEKWNVISDKFFQKRLF